MKTVNGNRRTSETVSWSFYVKKIFFKKFAKCTEKRYSQSLFFNKVASPQPAVSLKNDIGTGIFLWIFKNTSFDKTPPVPASTTLICKRFRICKILTVKENKLYL